MENQELDTGFEEFMSAFDDDFGNQTENRQEDGQEEQPVGDSVQQETPEENAEAPEEAQENSERQNPEAPAAAEPETFTLKVNHEERTYTREEMISLAQKGADYDRVRDRLNGQQETMDLLTDIAKQSDTDLPGLLDTLRLNLLKKQGLSEDAAKERLAREKVERENAALKAANAKPEAEETPKEKARREVAEFQKAFPEVQLTDQLTERLKEDIMKGFSMTEAYRRLRDKEQIERIKELEQQLAAQKQNDANRRSSPGSQKDSGGRHKHDDFDDFMKALQ